MLGKLDTTANAQGRSTITRLRLDGDRAYPAWLTPGDEYRLVFDRRREQWIVTGGSWFRAGHVYCLTSSGNRISSVPTDDGDGTVRIVSSVGYLIREDVRGDWVIVVVDR